MEQLTFEKKEAVTSFSHRQEEVHLIRYASLTLPVDSTLSAGWVTKSTGQKSSPFGLVVFSFVVSSRSSLVRCRHKRELWKKMNWVRGSDVPILTTFPKSKHWITSQACIYLCFEYPLLPIYFDFCGWYLCLLKIGSMTIRSKRIHTLVSQIYGRSMITWTVTAATEICLFSVKTIGILTLLRDLPVDTTLLLYWMDSWTALQERCSRLPEKGCPFSIWVHCTIKPNQTRGITTSEQD